jgi:hypothetical protein
MAINFLKQDNGNILITETGKPNVYLMKSFAGVMTHNDAGTHIKVSGSGYNLTFSVRDIGTINGSDSGLAEPWTLEAALYELDSKVFKV